jgi:hypothetical protein
LHAVRLPVALAAIQVDVTTRMGALGAPTPTGITALDAMLLGGLRSGTLLSVAGHGGSGKTAMALLLAYMAARARAAVLFASGILDETEIMARLAARALYREYPESQTGYGAIWSGEAWQDDYIRAAVGTSVNVAVRKVGTYLHLMRLRSGDSTAEIAAAAAHLWGRHERVVVVVDGLESLYASCGGDAARAAVQNADWRNRISSVAHELHQIADSGCAMVCTGGPASSEFIGPAATLTAELCDVVPPRAPISGRDAALGGREVDLVVTKNRMGSAQSIPLRFIAGCSLFEELNAT